jgi:hypothetical protein
MRQDEPRDSLPVGAAWNLVDFIPDLGADLTGRGGYAYASPNLASVKATAAYTQSLAYAPFAGIPKLCAIDQTGEFYTVTSPTVATDIGLASTCLQTPFFYRQNLCVPNPNGTSAPATFNGTALASGLFDAAMVGRYGCTYKDRGIVAGSAAQPQRVSFTNAGAFTFTSTAWIDVSGPVQGIAALRNAILVFTPGKCERIRGATPPPGSDMILEPIFEQGVADARSIVNFNDYIVFANGSGIFLSDGAVIQDLTKVAGMSTYWRTLARDYTSTWTISAGQLRNYYMIAVNDGTTFKDAFLLNLDKRTMVRVSNIPGDCFAHTVGVAPELYFGSRTEPRVCSTSSFFTPSAAYKTDANGAPVLPQTETAFTPMSGKMRMRDFYLKYDLRDSAADNPSYGVSLTTDPAQTSYTPIGTLPATTGFKRGPRLPIRRHAEGFGFRVAQAGVSASSKIYGIELDGYAEEGSRIG